MAEKARAAAMIDARARAEAKVAEAKKSIRAESEAAQVGLRAEADRLANEIVAALLRPVGAAYRPSVGGQS